MAAFSFLSRNQGKIQQRQIAKLEKSIEELSERLSQVGGKDFG